MNWVDPYTEQLTVPIGIEKNPKDEQFLGCFLSLSSFDYFGDYFIMYVIYTNVSTSLNVLYVPFICTGK